MPSSGGWSLLCYGIKCYLLLGPAQHGPFHPKRHIHRFLHSRLLFTWPRCQCWNTKCSRTIPTFQVLREAHWGWTEEPFLPRSFIHQGLSETPGSCLLLIPPCVDVNITSKSTFLCPTCLASGALIISLPDDWMSCLGLPGYSLPLLQTRVLQRSALA